MAALSLLAATGAAGALAADGANAGPPSDSPGTPKSVKELQEEFLKLKFGMFIHYNMATFKGVQWVEGTPVPRSSSRGLRPSIRTPGRMLRFPPA
jgi:alpha-L-fucosidase